MTLSGPVWRSPFRPFFLLGPLYGILLFLTWIPGLTNLVPPPVELTSNLPSLWHQHEMVFGFATAIIIGFIMTALPSWANTTELKGRYLFLLVLSWLLGRLAVLLSPLIPLPLVAVLDLSFPLFFAFIVRPELFNVDHRILMGLIVIVASFFIGNLSYYLGVYQQDIQLWQLGLRLGYYAMIFHCSVTVGILAPIFTENALAENGLDTRVSYMVPLQWLSAISIITLALADISAAPAVVCGTLALLCFVLHGIRLLRWHSLSIMNTSLVWVLHLGYFWLCVSLFLRALEGFGVSVGTESWTHAFTIGGFGLMSQGLMTRVTLRHTGRELEGHPAMLVAFVSLATAALFRMTIPIAALGQEILVLSGVLWLSAYMVYLVLYGRFLLTPSLPVADTRLS